MKRLLLCLLTLTLLLALTAPALAHHAEFAWETRTITVLDAVGPTMRKGSWAHGYWRKARHTVFSDYTAGGFDFAIRRGDPAACPDEDWPALPPGTILLCRVPPGAIEPTGFMQEGVGLVHTPPGSRHFLCHEVGHVLGLGHRAESGTCMNVSGWWGRPDAHDIEQLAVLTGSSGESR